MTDGRCHQRTPDKGNRIKEHAGHDKGQGRHPFEYGFILGSHGADDDVRPGKGQCPDQEHNRGNSRPEQPLRAGCGEKGRLFALKNLHSP